MTFSPTPPTKPGAYWWKRCDMGLALVVHIMPSDNLHFFDPQQRQTSRYAREAGGVWSPRLVPVDEVERAYREGYKDGDESVCPKETFDDDFNHSHAKRVVDGTEDESV